MNAGQWPRRVVSRAADALASQLDVRTPTTTSGLTEAERQQILACVQPGDILLGTSNAYARWQAGARLLLRSNYTHCALVEGDGNIIHTDGAHGVSRKALAEQLQGPVRITLIRPPYQTEGDRQAAIAYCRSQLGTPFDARLNDKDDSKLYCTELLRNALRAGKHPLDIPATRVLKRWEIVSPASFVDVPGTQVLHDGKSRYDMNALSRWPVDLAMLGGAVAGAAVGGPLAAVAGATAARTAAIVVGNGLQTGHFNLTGEP